MSPSRRRPAWGWGTALAYARHWRKKTDRRSLVEGAFGILKNPSCQRLRRGQNRLPGLAMARSSLR
jgi:hypothetical protein